MFPPYVITKPNSYKNYTRNAPAIGLTSLFKTALVVTTRRMFETALETTAERPPRFPVMHFTAPKADFSIIVTDTILFATVQNNGQKCQ